MAIEKGGIYTVNSNMKIITLRSGQAVILKKKNIGCVNIKCCDCGLVHLMVIEITRKGYMKVRFWRHGK